MGLVTLLIEVDVRLTTLLSPFDGMQGPVYEGTLSQATSNIIFKYQLDLGCVGVLNATEKCFRCNSGLVTLPGEIHVQFIVLLSSFDRSQRPIYGGNVSQVISNIIMNYDFDPGDVGASGCDKPAENVCLLRRGLASLPGELSNM